MGWNNQNERRRRKVKNWLKNHPVCFCAQLNFAGFLFMWGLQSEKQTLRVALSVSGKEITCFPLIKKGCRVCSWREVGLCIRLIVLAVSQVDVGFVPFKSAWLCSCRDYIQGSQSLNRASLSVVQITASVGTTCSLTPPNVCLLIRPACLSKGFVHPLQRISDSLCSVPNNLINLPKGSGGKKRRSCRRDQLSCKGLWQELRSCKVASVSWAIILGFGSRDETYQIKGKRTVYWKVAGGNQP